MGNRSGLAVQKLLTLDLKACLLTCLAVDTSCSLGPCLDLPARILRCGLFMGPELFCNIKLCSTGKCSDRKNLEKALSFL